MHMAEQSGTAGPTALQEWSTGWLLVASALVAYGSAAVYSFALGLFIAPLQEEFGWSRGAITGGFLLSATLTAIGAPFVGRLIDIYGSRRIGILGMAIYCFAVAMLGTTSGWIWNWWALWLLIAGGSVFVKPTVWIAAVSRAFTASRGLAIAIAMTGGGIFAAITPTITTLLIDAFGWRGAYFALGAGLAILNLPLLFLFFDRKRATSEDVSKAPPPPATGYSIRPSITSRRYIQLGVLAFFVTVAMIGINVHFVPILVSFEVGRLEAAGIAGLIGIGSIIGRLGTGFFLDRFHGPIVGMVAFSLPIMASALLLFAEGGNMVAFGAIAAFIYGSALGAELDILAYLTSRYFGLKNYGVLFGSLVALVAFASGVGPTTAGILYDITGDYRFFLYLTMASFSLGIFAVGTLGRYPENFNEEPAEPSPAA